jgi:hypothetical protein
MHLPEAGPQPLKEESLLTGLLEQTNEPYAIAKIAGIKMAESYRRQYGVNYISAMPTNLYGPNDNYDLNNSHVLPALIRKFHTAKVTNAPSVEVWGTGLAHARVPARGRPGRCLLLPVAELRRGDVREHRHRRGPHHQGAGRDDQGHRGYTGE